jgi:hypothetical protein
VDVFGRAQNDPVERQFEQEAARLNIRVGANVRRRSPIRLQLINRFHSGQHSARIARGT